MMNWFSRRIIGGITGGTEGAWFVFLLSAGAIGFLHWAEYRGHEMTNSFALMNIIGVAAIANLAQALGLKRAEKNNWIKPKSGQIELEKI